ncbi:uncharacterized protein LOC127262566 isoform X2 [Andrographis paniculata]|uniref:uncharacterized protein LOC127262566 isoform X2 n=1 Tax=Andrographis paniculata TaxID=175694 RepID=UPI0021E743EC|nr:uncharacterized protein LOC127262566 isoform X2 [Andrographis paniculata]
MEKTTTGDGVGGIFSSEKMPESVAVSACAEKSARDHFYEKLGKLNELSGLSFVFNFRETTLDLHNLYREVIQRGGFYQVTKFRKWDDVASAKHLKKSPGNIRAAQLQSIYETLLLQYELMYCRREIRKEANIWPEKSSLGFRSSISPGNSSGKRKYCEVQSDDGNPEPISGHNIMQKNPTTIVSSSSSIEEFIEADAPVKPRSGYQIFLKLETKRLKTIHGETSSSHNLREMAIQSWRSLSVNDKQPYIEASKMDRERYKKEMAVYEQRQSQSYGSESIPRMISFSTPGETDDVYHVALEPDSDNMLSPDESIVELAVDIMKNNESNDSMFEIDWDYGSLI